MKEQPNSNFLAFSFLNYHLHGTLNCYEHETEEQTVLAAEGVEEP